MKHILNKNLLNRVKDIKNAFDLQQANFDKQKGFVKIRQSEPEATKWLDDMDKEDVDPNQIMQEYRDEVMLKHVFNLDDGDQNNILETTLSTKFEIAKNPLNFGERFRNFNVIQKENLYYIVVDDTTEVKN